MKWTENQTYVCSLNVISSDIYVILTEEVIVNIVLTYTGKLDCDELDELLDDLK